MTLPNPVEWGPGVSPAGLGPILTYRFDEGTANADPGRGRLRFDNAAIAAATGVIVSRWDVNGLDLTAWWLALQEWGLSNWWLSSVATPTGVPAIAVTIGDAALNTNHATWFDFSFAVAAAGGGPVPNGTLLQVVALPKAAP